MFSPDGILCVTRYRRFSLSLFFVEANELSRLTVIFALLGALRIPLSLESIRRINVSLFPPFVVERACRRNRDGVKISVDPQIRPLKFPRISSQFLPLERQIRTIFARRFLSCIMPPVSSRLPPPSVLHAKFWTTVPLLFSAIYDRLLTIVQPLLFWRRKVTFPEVLQSCRRDGRRKILRACKGRYFRVRVASSKRDKKKR